MEANEAVKKSLKLNKAPGLDGNPLEVFKQYDSKDFDFDTKSLLISIKSYLTLLTKYSQTSH